MLLHPLIEKYYMPLLPHGAPTFNQAVRGVSTIYLVSWYEVPEVMPGKCRARPDMMEGPHAQVLPPPDTDPSLSQVALM